MTDQEALDLLKKEGYEKTFIVPMESGFDTGEHTHDVPTVHLILEGELIIVDPKGTQVYRAGDRVEFSAGTTHGARSGNGRMRMAVGMK